LEENRNDGSVFCGERRDNSKREKALLKRLLTRRTAGLHNPRRRGKGGENEGENADWNVRKKKGGSVLNHSYFRGNKGAEAAGGAV